MRWSSTPASAPGNPFSGCLSKRARRRYGGPRCRAVHPTRLPARGKATRSRAPTRSRLKARSWIAGQPPSLPGGKRTIRSTRFPWRPRRCGVCRCSRCPTHSSSKGAVQAAAGDEPGGGREPEGARAGGHEALIVAHDETRHPHVHMVANRVDPETGKAAKLGNSKLRLSRWAEGYEREQGRIRCERRARNNARRRAGEEVVRIPWNWPLHWARFRREDMHVSAAAALAVQHGGPGVAVGLQSSRGRLLEGVQGRLDALARLPGRVPLPEEVVGRVPRRAGPAGQELNVHRGLGSRSEPASRAPARWRSGGRSPRRPRRLPCGYLPTERSG